MEMKDILKQHADAFEQKLKGNTQAIEEVKHIIFDIEQKLARVNRSSDLTSFDPSAGQAFVNAEEAKGFLGLSSNDRGGRRLSIEVKAIVSSLTTNADGSAGAAVQPYVDAAVPTIRRELMVRDLLPTVRITTGSVEYPRVSSFTNAAATVSETSGPTKPQSDIKLELVTVPIRTIAHWMLATRQVLDDSRQLLALIDGELRDGLAQVEDSQLLLGSGTGSDISGIYTQGTAFAAGALTVTGPNKVDVIGACIAQLALSEQIATGVVMNPVDWMSIIMNKDAALGYLFIDPLRQVSRTLFGLPVVLTTAMTAGNFLVGDFRQATLYDRWDARVEVSTEDSDNFRRNLVTLLCEERIGLAVKRATAFIKGSFATAITDLTS
ncbi:phage major capsid protein [soil metagenome]